MQSALRWSYDRQLTPRAARRTHPLIVVKGASLQPVPRCAAARPSSVKRFGLHAEGRPGEARRAKRDQLIRPYQSDTGVAAQHVGDHGGDVVLGDGGNSGQVLVDWGHVIT